MTLSQRRSSKLPAANPPMLLTEAQTAFAVVLGQCLAKEWLRRTAPRQPSVPTGLNDESAGLTQSGTFGVVPK